MHCSSRGVREAKEQGLRNGVPMPYPSRMRARSRNQGNWKQGSLAVGRMACGEMAQDVCTLRRPREEGAEQAAEKENGADEPLER